MKKIVLVLLAIVILSGCATRTVWVHPEYTPEKWKKDSYECEKDARQSGYFGGGITGLINMQNFFNRCLESKGWTRQQEAQTTNVSSGICHTGGKVFKIGETTCFGQELYRCTQSDIGGVWRLAGNCPPTSATNPLSIGTTHTVTWNVSAAFSGPGDKYPAVATFRKGDRLTIVEQSGEWVKVRSESDQVGWVRSEVLE